MNLLHTLTQAADEEQLRLNPLPQHAAAAQEEHLRWHYALLLAATLTAQPAISEAQTRLLRLLLDALQLGDIRGELFEKARDLTPETLLEAARLVRDAGFAYHLVVDALVLLRLDAPLSEDAARLVVELAAFLGLDEAELARCAATVCDILDLRADDEAAASDPRAPSVSPVAQSWPARLPQPLTQAALQHGLDGGLWVLEADLAVDFPWQATDAWLVFRNGATLNTFAKTGEVKLTGCRLVDAALQFQGACAITLERCDWAGDYDPTLQRIALHSLGQPVTVTHCQFSTRNARAIAVLDAALTLTGSRFTRCGHPELNGGAVWHAEKNRTITDCTFDRCVAARGGAIWTRLLFGIERCEFIACQSLALEDQEAGDVAVFTGEQVCGDPAVAHCVFRQTSLVIGNSAWGHSVTFVKNSQFLNGNLYYFNKYSSNTIASECTFDGGKIIERQFA